jgi:hypothetical protein
MPFRSTRETIAQGRVSALAICETLIAMGASLTIAVLTGTFRHLAVASIIAPILLLQTKGSVEQTQFWVAQYVQLDVTNFNFGSIRADRFLVNVVRRRRLTRILYPIYFIIRLLNFISKSSAINPLSYLRMWLVLLFIRVFAIAYSFLIGPIEAIRQIPINWKIVALSIDSFHAPELIPGIEEINVGPLSELKARNLAGTTVVSAQARLLQVIVDESFIDIFKDPMSISVTILESFLNVIQLSFALIATYLYRFSLKSTAIIWSPLLWIMSIAEDGMPVNRRLNVICKTVWYKISKYLVGTR